jgi:hypothetical protein
MLVGSLKQGKNDKTISVIIKFLKMEKSVSSYLMDGLKRFFYFSN